MTDIYAANAILPTARFARRSLRPPLARRLLDWNGRKTGDGLERVMEDVYQRLVRDRQGIIMDDGR